MLLGENAYGSSVQRASPLKLVLRALEKVDNQNFAGLAQLKKSQEVLVKYLYWIMDLKEKIERTQETMKKYGGRLNEESYNDELDTKTRELMK